METFDHPEFTGEQLHRWWEFGKSFEAVRTGAPSAQVYTKFPHFPQYVLHYKGGLSRSEVTDLHLTKAEESAYSFPSTEIIGHNVSQALLLKGSQNFITVCKLLFLANYYSNFSYLGSFVG